MNIGDSQVKSEIGGSLPGRQVNAQIPKNASLRCVLFRHWEEVRDMAEQWEELLESCSTGNSFLTYEWIESWWMAFGKSRELFLVGLFDMTGRLMGIAPFYRIRGEEHTGSKIPIRVLRFLGSGTGGMSTSLGLITRCGHESACAKQIVRWLSDSRSQWDILDLHLMAAESPPTQSLMLELERNGWLRIQKEEVHLLIPLPDSYEEYLRSLSKKMRSEVSYEHRRLLRQFNVNFRKTESEEDLNETIETLFHLNTLRWQARGQSGSFYSAERRLFCREMAKRFFARKWLDFWVLDLDGRPAALEYGFRYKDTYYPLWVALDMNHGAYAAGFVLRSLIIQELIHEGIKIYEFMNGNEAYKYRWGVETRTYISVICAAPRSKGEVYLRLRQLKDRSLQYLACKRYRAREIAHSSLPPWALNFLRGIYRGLGPK